MFKIKANRTGVYIEQRINKPYENFRYRWTITNPVVAKELVKGINHWLEQYEEMVCEAQKEHDSKIGQGLIEPGEFTY